MKSFFLTLFVILIGYNFTFSQPNPPTNLTAQVIVQNNHRAIKLDWSAPTTSNVKFRVFKKVGTLSDTTQFIRIATNLSTPTYLDRNVFLNQTYCYYVVAYNNSGVSGPSNTVQVTVVPPVVSMAVITGNVFNDANNNPIARAKVELITQSAFGNKYAITDSLGNFKLRVPAGNYYLQTSAFGFYREFYNNVQNIQQATLITLANGDSVNFSIGLAPIVPPTTYLLSGNVTKDGGIPIRARISVFPVRSNTFYNPTAGRHTFTDSLGNYSVRVKENDTVVVYCHPIDFTLQPEFFDNKQTFAEADRIVVNGNINNINFVISPKPVYNNGISGLVKNEDNEGVESFVSAFRKNNQAPNLRRRITVSTDTLGNYQFTNLVPGEYILLAVPKSGYKATFFKYDGSQTLNWRNADSIVVNETSLITGINFTVIPISTPGFAKLSGYVKDNLNQPVEGAFVFAIDETSNIYTFGITDRNGYYQIEGFELTNYSVYVDKFGYNSNGVRAITFDNQTNFQRTLNFTLTLDNPTSNDTKVVPTKFELGQNYPNPFNPSTTISWQTPVSGINTIKVYNILGVEVATLVNEWKDAGSYSINFDASGLPSGTYFYKLTIGNQSQVRKMMLVK
ncbi:MAG: carboxypeptidase regulatory-like domain-containing protein [Ignavibacterium sp.]|nr:carboxypeptidase regulatory-like domain-containing protein [Ignavibacterium sp.]